MRVNVWWVGFCWLGLTCSTSAAILFEDDFHGLNNTTPDSAKWFTEEGRHGFGNQEKDCKTNWLTNRRLNGLGQLILEVRREDLAECAPLQYTSARINTGMTVSPHAWTYFDLEMRAKMPVGGNGVFPAFWMAALDKFDTDQHPACGELDWEFNGKTQKMLMTLIDAQTGVGGKQHAVSQPPAGIWQDWHVYRLIHTPGLIRWLIDGIEVKREVKDSDITWPFDDNKYFLVLNWALGLWAGTPDATTPMPQQLVFDYVRVSEPIIENLPAKTLTPTLADGKLTFSVSPDVQIRTGTSFYHLHLSKPTGSEVYHVYNLQPFILSTGQTTITVELVDNANHALVNNQRYVLTVSSSTLPPVLSAKERASVKLKALGLLDDEVVATVNP